MKQLQRKIHTGATNDKYEWVNVALVDANEGDELRVVEGIWVYDECGEFSQEDFDNLPSTKFRTHVEGEFRPDIEEASNAITRAMSFEPEHILRAVEDMGKAITKSDIKEAMERR